MYKRVLLWSVMAPALLGGCAVDKDAAVPSVDYAENWAESTALTPGWPSQDWWRQFHSPRLDDLMSKAITQNLDIASATARIKQADALARIAGAPLLPRVDALLGGQRMRSPELDGIQQTKQGTIYSPALSAGYELDFWGKNAAAQVSATTRAEASRFDRQTVLLTTQAAVAETYFRILGLQERMQVARENLRDAESALDAFRGRLSLGAATELDVAQQETQVERQKLEIPVFEEGIRKETDALAVLIGELPERMDAEAGSVSQIDVPAIGAGLPSGLLTRRPDVQKAEAEMRSQRANVEVARLALLPDISLTVEGGFASSALASLFNPASTLFTLAASLVQPIFEGGKLEGTIDLEQARYEALIDQYRKAILVSFSDVEDGLSVAAKTKEEEEIQRRALNAAQRAHIVATAQMEGGTANVLTVLIAERDLFRAKDDLVKARQRRLEAVVGLFRALGGGWNRDQ